jgi:hypothetical protein
MKYTSLKVGLYLISLSVAIVLKTYVFVQTLTYSNTFIHSHRHYFDFQQFRINVKLGPCKAELVCRDRVTIVSAYPNFSQHIINYAILSVTYVLHAFQYIKSILCAELFQ